MKLDLPDEYVPLVINALEHYDAYLRAVQREDTRYLNVAELIKRKGATSEGETEKSKKKRA